MEWNHLFQYGVETLIAVILGYAVKVLSDMRTSIAELNQRMATIVEKVSWHEKQLNKHDSVLDQLTSLVHWHIAIGRKK